MTGTEAEGAMVGIEGDKGIGTEYGLKYQEDMGWAAFMDIGDRGGMGDMGDMDDMDDMGDMGDMGERGTGGQ